jgi:hypothetical protein
MSGAGYDGLAQVLLEEGKAHPCLSGCLSLGNDGDKAAEMYRVEVLVQLIAS